MVDMGLPNGLVTIDRGLPFRDWVATLYRVVAEVLENGAGRPL